MVDLYTCVDEANGKSCAFTIKQQSVTETDCVGALWYHLHIPITDIT